MGVWCSIRPRKPIHSNSGLAALILAGALLTTGAFIGNNPYEGTDQAQAPDLESLPFYGIINALDESHGAPPGQAVAGPLRAIADAHGVYVGQWEGCPDLAQAIILHAERLGTPQLDIVQVPRIPTELDEALACLLFAVHQANVAMDRTFEGLTARQIMSLYEAGTEKRPLTPVLEALLEGRDHAHNLAAAIHIAEAVDHAVPLLQELKASGAPLPPIDLEPILRFTPSGDTYYERNYALIVDLEGDDVYDNHAGGAFIAAGSGIWDVEEDSGFFGTSVAGQNIVVGGNVQDADAVISSSVVLDLDGDDTYGVRHPPMLKDKANGCTEHDLVHRVATIGSGVIGTGMLFDLDGNDTFIGRTLTQGSGHLLGVGVLYSGGGDDTFEAARFGQGSGVFGGIGLLINNDGDNTYLGSVPEGGVWNGDLLFCDEDARYLQGSGFTSRPGHSIPTAGLLADLGGDTFYRADRKAHGFGQGPGFGILYDRTGSDVYHAKELAQGAAQGRNADTHPQSPWGSGLGVLFDREGDDNYTLLGDTHGFRGQGYSLGQPKDDPLPEPHQAVGWALDRNEAVGLHLDTGGVDTYTGPPGRGNNVAYVDGLIGLFVNQEGDDI